LDGTSAARTIDIPKDKNSEQSINRLKWFLCAMCASTNTFNRAPITSILSESAQILYEVGNAHPDGVSKQIW